jgi:hypothetical protein
LNCTVAPWAAGDGTAVTVTVSPPETALAEAVRVLAWVVGTGAGRVVTGLGRAGVVVSGLVGLAVPSGDGTLDAMGRAGSVVAVVGTAVDGGDVLTAALEPHAPATAATTIMPAARDRFIRGTIPRPVRAEALSDWLARR